MNANIDMAILAVMYHPPWKNFHNYKEAWKIKSYQPDQSLCRFERKRSHGNGTWCSE